MNAAAIAPTPLPTPDQLEIYNIPDLVSPVPLGEQASDGGDDSDVSMLLYDLQRAHVCFHREHVKNYVPTSPGLVVELSNGDIGMLFVSDGQWCKSDIMLQDILTSLNTCSSMP